MTVRELSLRTGDDPRLWYELGTAMRTLRGRASVSLREFESRGEWCRSTLSQVENAVARPSRRLVEWYDGQLRSDGLLLSIYAEAQARHARLRLDPSGDTARPRRDLSPVGEDGYEVVSVDPPAGLVVGPGRSLTACFVLRNTGACWWRGRKLRRMGAYSGGRLIGSGADVDVPDTGPGAWAAVEVELTAPPRPGSVVAYWSMVDETGADRALTSRPVRVRLVVR